MSHDKYHPFTVTRHDNGDVSVNGRVSTGDDWEENLRMAAEFVFRVCGGRDVECVERTLRARIINEGQIVALPDIGRIALEIADTIAAESLSIKYRALREPSSSAAQALSDLGAYQDAEAVREKILSGAENAS